jgi:thiosulfate dehydrogenase
MKIANTLFRRFAAGMGALALIGLATATVPAPAAAQDGPEVETDIFTIARGGLLYDKWYAVLEHDPPDRTHPAYPAAGKQKGGSTWRCKECHGWDYKGVDGAYGKGSHYTGIKGIRAYVGTPIAAVEAIIRNDTHGYTEDMIPDSAVTKLALFVSLGQVDMDQYIDRATKTARGNVERGARFYQTICAVCHGFEGKAINFKDEEKPEYIGTVGNANPWETLHKIRNGQPGVGMVALGALSIQDQVDILAYTQTLPEK